MSTFLVLISSFIGISRTFTDLRSSIDLQITLRLAILGFFLNYIFKSVKSVKKWNVLPKSNLQLLALKLMICKIVLIAITFQILPNSIITKCSLDFSKYNCFSKGITFQFKKCLVAICKSCTLLHHIICPIIAFLFGFNRLLLLTKDIFLICRSQASAIFAKQSRNLLFMGTFKHIFINFIYYVVINNFYDVDFNNV